MTDLSHKETRFEKRDWLWMVVIFACAIVLRGVYGAGYELLNDQDSTAYIGRARDMLTGGGLFHTHRMPLYPLFIAAWTGVLGDAVVAAKVASVVNGAMVPALVWVMGLLVYGRRVAGVAATLTVVSYALVEVSAWEMSEATYTMVLCLGWTLVFLAVRSERWSAWVAAGAAFGLAYWTRPEGLGYLGLVPLLVVINHRIRHRRWITSPMLARLAVFVIAGMVFVVPNVLHIKETTGAWSINGRTNWAALIHSRELEGELDYEATVFGLTPDKRWTMVEGGFGELSVLKSYTSNIGFKIKDMLEKLGKTYLLIPSVLSLVAISLAALGLFGLRWSRADRWAEVYLAGALVPWLTVYPLYDIDFENLSPIVPIVLLWVALGVVRLGERVSAGIPREWPGWTRRQGVALAAIVLATAVFEIPGYAYAIRNPPGTEDHQVYREIGAWIDANVPPSASLVARKGFIPTYADRRYVPLPFAPLSDILVYARYRRADVLVMDELYRDIRPQLVVLLDTPADREGLRLLYVNDDVPGRRVVLYAIEDAPSLAVEQEAF